MKFQVISWVEKGWGRCREWINQLRRNGWRRRREKDGSGGVRVKVGWLFCTGKCDGVNLIHQGKRIVSSRPNFPYQLSALTTFPRPRGTCSGRRKSGRPPLLYFFPPFRDSTLCGSSPTPPLQPSPLLPIAFLPEKFLLYDRDRLRSSYCKNFGDSGFKWVVASWCMIHSIFKRLKKVAAEMGELNFNVTFHFWATEVKW